jgi:hypothetical protein
MSSSRRYRLEIVRTRTAQEQFAVKVIDTDKEYLAAELAFVMLKAVNASPIVYLTLHGEKKDN